MSEFKDAVRELVNSLTCEDSEDLHGAVRSVRAEERVCNLHAGAVAAAQARIDALMLEFCPERMTDEQIANWEAHQRPVESWRPIDTAPKDGSVIWVRGYDPVYGLYDGPARWTGRYWRKCHRKGFIRMTAYPSFWMPLRSPLVLPGVGR